MPKLAIVWAEFNALVTEEMRDRALACAKELGYDAEPVWKVAGSYDLPFAVDRALARPDVAGAVAIGCIITGETKHDDTIAAAAAKALLDVSIARGKPVGLGITGPGQTFAQAKDRVDRAEAAVEAVHALLSLK
ncbi:MAG: 6,7-dimethyl-8-ribityllumazine synthase [Thermoplasmatota archaeon]